MGKIVKRPSEAGMSGDQLRGRFKELLESTGMKDPVALEKVNTLPESEILTLMDNLYDQIAEGEKEFERKKRLAEVEMALKALKAEENRLLEERDKVEAE